MAEISNAGFQWRLLAGAMGTPFIEARAMLGTDTLEKCVMKVARDPWTGERVCLLASCNPDVATLHVHCCDQYGNAQIAGILVMAFKLARAARRLLLTTEEIVDEEVMRAHPDRTTIPSFLVDAVCEVPNAAHQALMPYLYYFDEAHIHEWLTLSKTEEGTQAYLDKYL